MNKILKNMNLFNCEGESNFDFYKRKSAFLIAILASFVVLTTVFIVNLCTDQFEVDSMLEQTKIVTYIPVEQELDSYTLNKLQKTTTNVINANSTVQNVSLYDGHAQDILNRAEANLIKIVSIKSVPLDDQQKTLLLDELKMQFPDIFTVESNEQVSSFTLDNPLIDENFLVQVVIAFCLYILIIGLFFAIRFKLLNSVKVAVTTLISFVLSAGLTFFAVTLISSKINLVFIIAISIFITSNLFNLFNTMNNYLKQKPNEPMEPVNLLNYANNNMVPMYIFEVLIVTIALIVSIIFSFVYDNFLLTYLIESLMIGLIFDIVVTMFFSGQLWVMLSGKKLFEFVPKHKAKIKLN